MGDTSPRDQLAHYPREVADHPSFVQDVSQGINVKVKEKREDRVPLLHCRGGPKEWSHPDVNINRHITRPDQLHDPRAPPVIEPPTLKHQAQEGLVEVVISFLEIKLKEEGPMASSPNLMDNHEGPRSIVDAGDPSGTQTGMGVRGALQ